MPTLSDKSKSFLIKANLLAFILHLSLAIVTGIVSNLELSPAIYLTKITFIYNSSDEGFDLLPRYETYSGYPVNILTTVFFSITAFFHLANVTIFAKTYYKCLEQCFTPTRWLEYFITATIMIGIIAFLTGVRSVLVVIGVSGLIATTMLFGLLSELYNRPRASVDAWTLPTFAMRSVPHFLGYVPYAFAWFIILYSFFGAGGTCEAPDWVWAIVLGQFVLFSTFVIPQIYQLTHPPSKFVRGEYGFILLSFISKAFLGINLLIGGQTLDTWDADNIRNDNTTCDVIDLADL